MKTKFQPNPRTCPRKFFTFNMNSLSYINLNLVKNYWDLKFVHSCGILYAFIVSQSNILDGLYIINWYSTHQYIDNSNNKVSNSNIIEHNMEHAMNVNKHRLLLWFLFEQNSSRLMLDLTLYANHIINKPWNWLQKNTHTIQFS